LIRAEVEMAVAAQIEENHLGAALLLRTPRPHPRRRAWRAPIRAPAEFPPCARTASAASNTGVCGYAVASMCPRLHAGALVVVSLSHRGIGLVAAGRTRALVLVINVRRRVERFSRRRARYSVARQSR